MAEKTGIQLLEDLIELVSLLEKRFTIIEQNTKELLNRANIKQEIKQEIKPDVKPIATEPNQALATTKIIGKVKAKDGKLVSGVDVKIFDTNNAVAKETRTNRAGEMVCFLAPGKYRAEYFLENIINAKLDFTVNPDEKLVRLPQPL